MAVWEGIKDGVSVRLDLGNPLPWPIITGHDRAMVKRRNVGENMYKADGCGLWKDMKRG